MDQNRLVEIIWEEFKRAADIATDQFSPILRPGLVLQPLFLTIAEIAYGIIDVVETFWSQLQKAAVRIVLRVISESSVTANQHQVLTVRKAQLFASEVAQAAIYELSGNVPPPGLHVGERIFKFKGLKKRFIAIEERTRLGDVLYKALKFIRYPALELLKLGEMIWRTILVIMALGGCVVLFYIVNADFSQAALPQLRRRHRVCAKINRRMSPRKRLRKCS